MAYIVLILTLGIFHLFFFIIIDENQVILFKHIGPINNQVIENEMIPVFGK